MGFISRQIEKIYKNTLFRRHDPDGSIFYFSHSDFPGIVVDDFSFKSKRGHILSGKFYYYDAPRQDRLIIFEHGMGNGHNAYFREIERIARQGYTVFSYDHTGCNNSEGEHIYGLSGSLSDLDDCINALVNERGFSKSNISVIGHSWGGFSTLNILSLHPDIRSIVAMSGFRSISVMQKEAVPIPPHLRKGLYSLEQLTNPDYADSDAINTLKSSERPFMIIHSIDDATVSYKLNFECLADSLKHKENAVFLTVSGKGHNPTYTKDAFEYKEKFFKDLKKCRRRGKLKTKEERLTFASSYDWHKMTEQDEDVWKEIFAFLEK